MGIRAGARSPPVVAARNALLAAPRMPPPKVLSSAVVALGQRRNEVARPALGGLLAPSLAGIRYSAVRSLPALGVRTSAAALRRRRAVEPGEIKAAIEAGLQDDG